jgi:hypothetical protein
MLWRSSEIIGYGIGAPDGAIGSVDDLLFDDENWTVRWVVIETGSWLPGRRVLLPPPHFGWRDTGRRQFPVNLTRQIIKDSPDITADALMSRQMESHLYGYYRLSPYWAVGLACAPIGVAGGSVPPAGIAAPAAEREWPSVPHLRSTGEVTGYYIQATDDDIGHVEEFLVEDGSWTIRYMVVDTKNWWPGKAVLVAPQWIREVSWGDQQVFVDLTRQQVKDSPEYDPAASVDRAYEERLYRHYDRPIYWA